MKIMIVPMAAMAETHGPVSRCQVLAYGFKEAGFDVATCMAKDMNYREMDEIPNYYLDIPMPFGLPKAFASQTFPIAQKLGITSKKTVNSFDEVLWFTGNLDHRYLRKSVDSVRKAIRDFGADAVYSEFNISAIIAAKKEGVCLCTTVSYPTQHEYAHSSKLAGGLNRLLRELELPQVDSALKLFDLADRAFCPSIRELEPIDKPGVFYCGALKKPKKDAAGTGERNKIVIYMGNGTVYAKETLNVALKAFGGSAYEVYIASSYLESGDHGNVHVASRWDFDKLLNEAVLFINHGGQNSIADGLLYGVPQIIVPGKVFERKYNARCIADNNAGVVVSHREFNAAHLRTVADEIAGSPEMADNASKLGRKLTEAGGIEAIVREITTMQL